VFYRGRQEELKDFFSQEDGVVFYNDVCSVMEVLGREYKPEQLFYNTCGTSLQTSGTYLVHKWSGSCKSTTPFVTKLPYAVASNGMRSTSTFHEKWLQLAQNTQIHTHTHTHTKYSVDSKNPDFPIKE